MCSILFPCKCLFFYIIFFFTIVQFLPHPVNQLVFSLFYLNNSLSEGIHFSAAVQLCCFVRVNEAYALCSFQLYTFD